MAKTEEVSDIEANHPKCPKCPSCGLLFGSEYLASKMPSGQCQFCDREGRVVGQWSPLDSGGGDGDNSSKGGAP